MPYARSIMQLTAYNECFYVVTLRDKSKMPTHIYTEPLFVAFSARPKKH